jgi:hypothetical protein
MNYYIVTAKCGHVGNGRYILIDFAIRANTIHEATALARTLPRVKHDRKDAIVEAKEVTEETYEEAYARNAKDPYLLCRNSQDSRAAEALIESRVYPMSRKERKENSHDEKALFAQRKEKEFMRSLFEYAMEGC